MTNRNPEPRFDGRSVRITVNGRLLPLATGVMPEDFPDRLRRLKEASGLTWTAVAYAIGVDLKQLRRWLRKGVEPSGGPMMALFFFAVLSPGGLRILMGEEFWLILWGLAKEEEGWARYTRRRPSPPPAPAAYSPDNRRQDAYAGGRRPDGRYAGQGQERTEQETRERR